MHILSTTVKERYLIDIFTKNVLTTVNMLFYRCVFNPPPPSTRLRSDPNITALEIVYIEHCDCKKNIKHYHIVPVWSQPISSSVYFSEWEGGG